MPFVRLRPRFADLARSLMAQRIVRRTLSLSSGVALGQLAVMASTPILTRLCTPDDFGLFAFLYTFITLFGIVGLLQLEVDIPLCDDDELPVALLAQAVVGLAMLSSVLSVISLLTNTFDMIDGLPPWTLLLLPVSCLLQIVLLPAAYLHVRSGSFSVYGMQRMNRLLGQAGGQVALCWFELGSIGLLAGLIVGQIVALVTGIRAFWSAVSKIQWAHHRAIVSYLRRKYEYPCYILPANILGASAQLLPSVLVGSVFSAKEAGLLLLVQRLFAVPVRLVSHNVSQVLLGELRTLDPAALRRLTRRSMAALAAAGLAIAGIVILPGETGWTLMLGPGWNEFWYLLLCFTPLQTVTFVSEAARNLFLVVDKRLMIWQSGSGFLALGIFLLPLVAPLTFYDVVIGYVSAATLVHVIPLFVLVRRLDAMATLSQNTDNLPADRSSSAHRSPLAALGKSEP